MKLLKKTIAVILSLVLLLGYTGAFSEGEEWICPECGAAGTANFCIRCGTKKPEEIICPDCGTKYPIGSGAVFCGNCGAKMKQAAPLPIRYEEEGFSTPEEALSYYMEGLRNLDFDQMLSAFAWETQMEHYDFKAYFERTMSYSPTMRPRMPSVNDFMFSANVNMLRSYQAELIYRSLEQYILGDDSPSGSATGTIAFQKDSDDVAAFLQKFDNGKLEKLAQMANIRCVSPDDVTDNKFSAEMNRKSFIRQTACYGADEAVNLIGVADVGNETLYCYPTICRYGDKWYLVSVSSMASMLLGVSFDYQGFICGPGSLESLLH